jgi:putative ABC transport system substrate-binding protein
MANGIGRRQFISALGSAAAAWPLAVRAQQPALPVIGFLSAQSSAALAGRLRGFQRGLKEEGYVEGDNVAIEYRWADSQLDRLPVLAAELVRRRVAVIAATGGNAAALAAKATTTTIPIVFDVNEDPVRLGLVSSLARPAGNLTGINFFSGEVVAKRLELLHQLVPKATRIAVLINPFDVTSAETTLKDLEPAARSLGLQLLVFHATTSRDIDAAFAAIGSGMQPNVLFVGSNGFLASRRVQIVNAAMHQSIPAAFAAREFAEVGGLMSYGSDIADAYRQVGIYTGRILKGTKPTDLPVMQASKFELIINAQTARTLGLTVPPNLLALADEVIE